MIVPFFFFFFFPSQMKVSLQKSMPKDMWLLFQPRMSRLCCSNKNSKTSECDGPVCFLAHALCLLSVLGDSACLIPTCDVFSYLWAFPQVVPFTWSPLPSSLSGKLLLVLQDVDEASHFLLFSFHLLVAEQVEGLCLLEHSRYPIVYTSRSICTSLPLLLQSQSNLC